MPGELLLAEGRAPQQAADRGAGVGGDAAEPRHHLEEREGEGPHRALGQLRPRVHRHQASRRDREAALPQVHGVHDAAGGQLCHPAAEDC